MSRSGSSSPGEFLVCFNHRTGTVRILGVCGKFSTRNHSEDDTQRRLVDRTKNAYQGMQDKV